MLTIASLSVRKRTVYAQTPHGEFAVINDVDAPATIAFGQAPALVMYEPSERKARIVPLADVEWMMKLHEYKQLP